VRSSSSPRVIYWEKIGGEGGSENRPESRRPGPERGRGGDDTQQVDRTLFSWNKGKGGQRVYWAS